MRVAFVTPPTQKHPITRDMAGGLGFDRDETILLPPLDFVYCASQLRTEGHAAIVIDGDHPLHQGENLWQGLQEFLPTILVVMVSLPTLGSDCSFARELKTRFQVPVVVKTGIRHNPLWQRILQDSGAEFLLTGECEKTISRLLSRAVTDGTAWLEDGNLCFKADKPLVDLDELALPDWTTLSGIHEYRYSLLGPKTISLQTSRGCPFSCSFYCPYPLVQGRQWRGMSSSRMAEEIRLLLHHGIPRILFRDAVFTFDRQRTERFCDTLIRENLRVEWWCETRADRLDEPLLRLMRQAGCRGISIGVESGDQTLRQSVAKAGLNLDHLRRLTALSGRIDLKIHLLFMAGLPAENRRSLFATYHLIKTLKPDSHHITLVTPYPGTPLFDEATANGHLSASTSWEQFGGHAAIIPTDFLSPGELVYGKTWIDRVLRFRFSRNPIRRLLSVFGELWLRIWSRRS